MIKSGKGNDQNCGDNTLIGLGLICETGVDGGDDKINAGQGDDELTGSGGADKFKCGSGGDFVTDFDETEGDRPSGNCEGIEKGNSEK